MRKKSVRNIISGITFALLFCLIFSVVQRVLQPEWYYPSDSEDHGGKIREYKVLEENSVDVIFDGTSHVMYGINPMELYDERRIVSFNNALSAHRMSSMYYQMVDLFKTQSPSLLMADVSILYLDKYSEAPWRWTLDSMSLFDVDKLEALSKYADEYLTAKENEQAKKEEEEEKEEAIAVLKNGKLSGFTLNTGYDGTKDSSSNIEIIDDSKKNPICAFSEDFKAFNKKFKVEFGVLFPLYNYHSRWTGLNMSEFEWNPPYGSYGKGYVYTTTINRAWATKDAVNQAIVDITENDSSFPEYIAIGSKNHISISQVDEYKDTPEKEQLEWLEKLKILCDRNGVELRLMKVPVLSAIRDYGSSWTKVRSKKIHEIANSMGIEFLDMVYDVNIGIDPMTDFRDNGMHLNYYGAKKVTSYLGNYIKNVCGIKGRSDSYYNRTLPMYKKINEVAELQRQDGAKAYLKLLKENMIGKTIFFAVRGVTDCPFSKKQRALLTNLGAKNIFADSFGVQSYIGVIQNGKSVYEASGELPVETEISLGEEHLVSLYSVGSSKSNIKNPQASIIIDGKDYSLNGWGLNIVVYDNITNTVIDQRNFKKTDADSKLVCEKNTGKLDNDFRGYEYNLYKLYNEKYGY